MVSAYIGFQNRAVRFCLGLHMCTPIRALKSEVGWYSANNEWIWKTSVMDWLTYPNLG